MSGSNKRNRYGNPPVDACSTLSFEATVNSPQPGVLAKLKVGDVLDVVSTHAGQGAAVSHQGSVVGALTGTRVAQLINCMNSSFTYSATVKTLSGGQCIVRIDPL
jgi:hypothetical protein